MSIKAKGKATHGAAAKPEGPGRSWPLERVLGALPRGAKSAVRRTLGRLREDLEALDAPGVLQAELDRAELEYRLLTGGKSIFAEGCTPEWFRELERSKKIGAARAEIANILHNSRIPYGTAWKRAGVAVRTVATDRLEDSWSAQKRYLLSRWPASPKGRPRRTYADVPAEVDRLASMLSTIAGKPDAASLVSAVERETGHRLSVPEVGALERTLTHYPDSGGTTERRRARALARRLYAIVSGLSLRRVQALDPDDAHPSGGSPHKR